MRITEFEVSVIKAALLSKFSSVSQILLFGSRTDDNKRGGDIDLLVITAETGEIALQHKLEVLSDIQFALGEQKIDLVISCPGDEREIVKIAKETGIPI